MRLALRCFREILIFAAVLWCVVLASADDIPTVSFEGHLIRFSHMERPYYVEHTVMVSLRPVCAAMGAIAHKGRDAIHWTITRGSDRLDYAFGERWYIFNGARMELPALTEARGEILFVPFDLVETLAAGSLELNLELSARSTPEVLFRSRVLRFKREDAPVRIAGTVFVSLHATGDIIGARVERSRDKTHFTITRALDQVSLDQGVRIYAFNGAQKMLRAGAFTRGRAIFVPIEVFQSLVGDELRSR